MKPKIIRSTKSQFEDRETAGKIATDLQQKEPDTRSPIEIQREAHKNFEKEFFACIERGKKEFEYPRDLYIVVITKTEPLLPNVIRNMFLPRSSCPTPTFDQIVYKFHRKDERVQMLWVIPSKDACEHLKENASLVHFSEYDLLEFVLGFYDGTLDKLAITLNGEHDD